MEDRMLESPEESQNGRLTGTSPSVHCPATPVGSEAIVDLDRADIERFLETLAEVALAVASRRLQTDDGQR